MKPLVGGRLLSPRATQLLSRKIDNVRAAVIDSMERDDLIRAIAKHLYARAEQLSRTDDQYRRNRSGRKGPFHFGDLYR